AGQAGEEDLAAGRRALVDPDEQPARGQRHLGLALRTGDGVAGLTVRAGRVGHGVLLCRSHRAPLDWRWTCGVLETTPGGCSRLPPDTCSSPDRYGGRS